MSLVKNQIVRILSKFLKNVTADQIKLSLFKGRCELNDVFLDEFVIGVALGLPCWLLIREAKCAQVTVNIPWMQIRSSPILVNLCEVSVDVETVSYTQNDSESTTTNNNNGDHPTNNKMAATALSLISGSGYGIAQKIVENARVVIHNLVVTYKSSSLRMRAEIPSFVFESCYPSGEPVSRNDTSLSRINNRQKTETLIFKSGFSPVMKLQAFANDNLDKILLTLIANSVHLLCTIKRVAVSGQLLHVRVSTMIGEFLTVVSSYQLKATLTALVEIVDLMFKSFQDSQEYAQMSPLPGVQFLYKPDDKKDEHLAKARPIQSDLQANSFEFNDLHETSFHLSLKQIDLHMISDGLAKLDRILSDASVLMTIQDIVVDHYPCHIRGQPRYTRSKSKGIGLLPFDKQRLSWSDDILGSDIRESSLIEYSIFVSVDTIKIQSLKDNKSKTESLVLDTGDPSYGLMPCLEVDLTYTTTKASMTATLSNSRADKIVDDPQVIMLMANCSRIWKLTFDEKSIRWIAGFLMSSIPDQIFDLFAEWSKLTEGVSQSANFPYTCIRNQFFEIAFPHANDRIDESKLTFCMVEISNCLASSFDCWAQWTITTNRTYLQHRLENEHMNLLVWPCSVVVEVQIPVFGSITIPSEELLIDLKAKVCFVRDSDYDRRPYCVIRSLEHYYRMVRLLDQSIGLAMKLYEQEASSTHAAAQMLHCCRLSLDASVHSHMLILADPSGSQCYTLTVSGVRFQVDLTQTTLVSGDSGEAVSGFSVRSELKWSSCRSEVFDSFERAVNASSEHHSESDGDDDCLIHIDYKFQPTTITTTNTNENQIVVTVAKLSVDAHYGLVFFTSSLFRSETSPANSNLFGIPIKVEVVDIRINLVDESNRQWPIRLHGLSLLMSQSSILSSTADNQDQTVSSILHGTADPAINDLIAENKRLKQELEKLKLEKNKE